MHTHFKNYTPQHTNLGWGLNFYLRYSTMFESLFAQHTHYLEEIFDTKTGGSIKTNLLRSKCYDSLLVSSSVHKRWDN